MQRPPTPYRDVQIHEARHSLLAMVSFDLVDPSNKAKADIQLILVIPPSNRRRAASHVFAERVVLDAFIRQEGTRGRVENWIVRLVDSQRTARVLFKRLRVRLVNLEPPTAQ